MNLTKEEREIQEAANFMADIFGQDRRDIYLTAFKQRNLRILLKILINLKYYNNEKEQNNCLQAWRNCYNG